MQARKQWQNLSDKDDKKPDMSLQSLQYPGNLFSVHLSIIHLSGCEVETNVIWEQHIFKLSFIFVTCELGCVVWNIPSCCVTCILWVFIGFILTRLIGHYDSLWVWVCEQLSVFTCDGLVDPDGSVLYLPCASLDVLQPQWLKRRSSKDNVKLLLPFCSFLSHHFSYVAEF